MAQEQTLGKKRQRRRTSIGTRNILTVQGKEPGFVYRFVNDDGDAVAIREEQGYEVVRDSSVRVGDRRVANPTQEGSPVRVSVGRGTQAVLMRIPEEFYAEDQEAKHQKTRQLESQMKREAKEAADYGKLEIS